MGELMDGGVPNRGAMAQRLLVQKLLKWQDGGRAVNYWIKC